MPTIDIKKILEEYVATANNPEYKSDFTIINSKFPELKGYDPKLLEEYVATANNEEYKSDFNIINSKFPELFEPEKKKGFQTDLGKAYETTSGGSFPKYQGTPLVGSTPMTKMAPKQPSLPSNVGSNNPELSKLEKELNKKKEPLTNFEKQIKELDSKIAPYTELAKNNKGTLPKDKYQEYSFLIQRRNELANQYKAVYDEYKPLADKYNSIYQKDKKIIDTYNQELESYKKETEAIQKEKFQKEKQKLSKESPIVKIKSYEGALNIVNQRFNQNLELFNQAKQAGDEQAMAQLQPLLQIDSKKAEGLKKGIEAQKNEANFTAPDNAVDGFYIGVYQTIGQLMQGPKFLDEGIKRLAYQTTTGKSSKDLDKYFENRGTISDKIAAAGKIVSDFASERSDEMKVNRAYGGSATEALLNQDYSNAASFIFKDFLQNTPSSLSYINPATATLMTVGAVGEEMSQAERDGRTKDYNVILAGAIKGGLEIVTERWLGAGKAGIKLVNKLGREGAEQAIRNTAEQLVKKSLGRKLVEMQGEEVVGETINLIGSNLTDIYLNGRTDITPTTGISDNALNAVFGSVVQGGPATTLNHYIDKAKYNKAQAMREEAASLTDQAMDQPNEVAAQALEEKAAEIQAQADEIEQKESELAINASTETVDAIMEKEAQIDELSAAIEVATPETAPILEEKLNALEEERVALVEQATLEANEAIKALESIKEPIQEDETITTKEEDVQPMLEGVQTNRDENQAGETSPELRTEQTQEEEVVQETPAKEEVKAQEPIVEETPENKSKKESTIENFTEGKDLNRIFEKSKQKYGEKQGLKYNDVANRLVNPNKNTIIEVRSNGVVVKRGEQYFLLPFTNTDANYKKWELASPLEVTQQYQQVETNKQQKTTAKEEVKVQESIVEETPALKDVESTAKALEDISKNKTERFYPDDKVILTTKDGNEVEVSFRGYNGENKAVIFGSRGSGINQMEVDISQLRSKNKSDKLTKDERKNLLSKIDFQDKEAPSYNEDFTDKELQDLSVRFPNMGKLSNKEKNDLNDFQIATTPLKRWQEQEYGVDDPLDPVNIKLAKEHETAINNIINNDKFSILLSEAYHKAKQDGSNPELVKAVEELLTNKQQEYAVKTGKKSASNQQQYQGTAEQQQGEQEDRTNKEEPITQPKSEASGGNQPKQSRESKTKERVARTEKSIDEAAEWLKSKLKIDLPDGTKKSGGGFTDEQLIDLVAKAAKAVAKGAIVTAANIKEVLDTLREGGFLEGIDVKPIIVYHGGNVFSLDDINESNPLYVSESKSQANEYAKGNDGVVTNFLVNKNRIATEEKAIETIEKLGLKGNENSGYTNDELNLFELIDWVNFESTSINEEGVKLLFETLAKEGFGGIEFYDTNLITLKEDIKNIVIFNEDTITDLRDFGYVKLNDNIKVEDVIQALENLKADTKGKMNAFGIIPAIWNAGVDTIILAVKAGKSISEAIQEGINYFKENGAKFDEVEVTDFFNKLLSPKKEAPKVEQETPKEEPKKEKVEEPKSKTSKFFETISNNKSLEEANKVLSDDIFEYIPKSQDESRKKAKAYIDKVGVEDALENFLSNSVEGLELDEEVALASLLTIIINMGIERNIQEGNLEGRDVLEKKYQQLIEAARNRFTKLGQAVNAIKLFLESMSSPELAAYRLENSVRKANEEIKKKPSVKTNASTKVNSGKKTINEGVKTAAEEVAQELNNELYGVITKGKKGLTESQKKNVKDFFNKLKIDTKNASFSTIIPIPPKLYNDFVEAVGNLVVEGVSVSVAMTQISTEFIKNKIASPDELAQARKILSEEVNGLKEKKPLTEAQKQRNAAREELRKATSEYKEMEKLAKELEKERERVEKLRKEESKKQSERIDKATNELLAAERKEAEKNAKELEKKIKELTKEISQGKALQDQVEDIINEYLKMGAMDNTANQALIDLVKERLGITDEKQAVDVATKIAKSVVTNIREKLSKKWDADIKRQREKETKEKTQKDPHKEVNEFVQGVVLGSMNAEQFIELFGAKYGLETLTEQDFAKVRELAAKVRDAETKHRKAKALNDMVQYINSKAPVTLSQLFDELWYFKVLSPALTFFLGTADTNLTYNFTQVYNTIFELPIQQLITALKNKAEIAKDKKGLKKAEFILADAIRNIAMGYAKAVIQRGNIKNVDINANTFLNVIKTEGFLKDSITYFKEIMTEGSGAFQEFESPFKAGAKTEFEIRRWFKLAKNGDMQSKRNIVNAMLNSGADVLNLLVKSVPRSLAAGDLFFSAVIKNAYLPALVREYLIKNTDLRGAALNNEVSRILLNTDVELENAKQRAVENRMKFDIEIKPKMVGDKIVYEIYDKGDVVKQTISEYVKSLKLTRRKVLQFDTKEKANEYARKVVAPKSPMYEMDVTDYLNVKIPAQAMLGANRLAGQAILGGSPPGMSGQLLKGFNYLNDIIEKGTTGMEETADELKLEGEDSNMKYLNNPAYYALKTLAVVTKGLSRLMAFRRVGIMLARNYSNYVPPIGLLRYGMSYAGKSALFIDYLPDQIPSDVERDRMLAQVALGTFVTAVSVTSILALKGLMDDDDDKDERIAKAIKNIQEGTLVGSLSDILTKDQIAAYKASGDIQEFSIYLGLDKNGKRKWRSVKPDPSYSSALILATYAWNDIINKDDSALKSAGLGLASFYNQIKEMGIGQGLPKLSNARSIGEFVDIVAQTAFFDNLEITKIGLVTKLTQYLDRKKRLDPHWMDYVEDSDDYLQGTANYVMNEAIPFYNLGDLVRQPLSYGALGEEMYRTPSSEQGFISAYISYLDSGKNKETRNMYRWLASNGYDKIFYPNVSDMKDAEGNEIKLSMYEKNKLGMLAAKASYLELKKKKADLEVIRQTGGTKAFRTEVEKIFRSNFNDVVQLVKKKMASDAVQYEREKNDIEFNNKVEKLKADNEGLFELIDGIKSEISNAEVKLVPFEEMDTFGTALKEAKSSDKWNMITSNLNMLKGKYEKVALEQYLIYLEDLGYLQPELGKDAYNYMMGEKPE